jgi:hypothetical protein
MNWQTMLDNAGRWSLAAGILGVFAWQVCHGQSNSEVNMLVGAVMGYYFGKQELGK